MDEAIYLLFGFKMRNMDVLCHQKKFNSKQCGACVEAALTQQIDQNRLMYLRFAINDR